jgi:hypothetical protein
LAHQKAENTHTCYYYETTFSEKALKLFSADYVICKNFFCISFVCHWCAIITLATFIIIMGDDYCSETSGTELEARDPLKVDDCVNLRGTELYSNDATACDEEAAEYADSSFDRQSIVMSDTKFGQYIMIKVDPLQDYKASEIKLCSFARPHMRAFHFSWWSYHVAFLMW